MKNIKIKLVFKILAGIIFGVFVFILVYKKNIRDEQWNDPSIKKERVEGVIIKIYPGAKTNPRFEYNYKFKGDSYTNSVNFPKDLWNLRSDSLSTYIGKRIQVEFIESNPKNSRVLLKD
ncbi:hypothetical protein I215_10895 [Galbibacter marinus]|uniref:Uncharacterized protein n=1 Tax=Galbibacter marinus TaxID=555500 RepID=K2PTB8_9FLAO|nr:hypothetical protein [Galbibacter marinus]EKF54809.1 hypothetical protein I215_10895 [Galbibacter marinus]